MWINCMFVVIMLTNSMKKDEKWASCEKKTIKYFVALINFLLLQHTSPL